MRAFSGRLDGLWRKRVKKRPDNQHFVSATNTKRWQKAVVVSFGREEGACSKCPITERSAFQRIMASGFQIIVLPISNPCEVISD
jgi:hypothetical protein